MTPARTRRGSHWPRGRRRRPHAVLQAAGLRFLAFAGYARLATLGEEVVDPARTIPRAIPRALRVLAAITDPDVVDAILTDLGLPTVPPAVAAARGPPQVSSWHGALDPRPDLDADEPA